METEDQGYDSQLIHQQLTQEQPEDDDDDDDDGTVNLFLLNIVNQAATPSNKDKDAQANRVSSPPKSSPVAAGSSPRTRTGTEGTQNTQSSTQSDEGHFAHYMRRQKLAQTSQQPQQKSSPLRRPSTRAKPLSRSVTPFELPSEGKPDPYEFPTSPGREMKPQPSTAKDAEKARGKRKRKEAVTATVEREETPEEEDSQPVVSKRPRRRQARNAATIQRTETPEESVTARRPRRGQDKPEYSPGSLHKEKLARRRPYEPWSRKTKEENVEPFGKLWAVPRSARKSLNAEVKAVAEDEHEPEADDDEPEQPMEVEKTTPVMELPLKRTRSRKAELEAETVAAAQNKSVGDGTTYEDSTAIIGSSSTPKVNRKCASCYSKSSNHWHAHLWNEPANDKHYCNNCYSKDYRKKKKKENAEKQARAAPPNTALDILSSPPSTWAKSSKDAAAGIQVPATQSESQPSTSPPPPPESAYTVMMRKKHQEALADVQAESNAEVQMSSPIPETPKRSRRAKSSSVAPQSASPRVLRKPRQHFKDATLSVAPPSASQLVEEPAVEPSSPDAEAAKRHKTASPKVTMKPSRTTRQSRREAQQEEARASVEPPVNARATRSRKVEVANELSKIEEEVEQEEPETADFNMDDVPESLFVSQDEEVMEVDIEIQVEGDRDMVDAGEDQRDMQVVINDDDSLWEDDPEEEAEAEAEDEEDEGVPEEGGVSGITSILMAPSPKKVPSQRIAVPQRPLRSQGQNQTAGQPQKASTFKQPPPSPSPPIALKEDEDEELPVESQREELPAQGAADNSDTTLDYGRNPFDEPTFKFTSSNFSATSKLFIKDMPLDPDVSELVRIRKEVRTGVAGVDRHTQQARDIQKLQKFLEADYRAMRVQHDSEDPDEGLICDLYGNIYTNTRKLHKRVNAVIDNDLSDDPEDISNGEVARRNKLRKKLLRDIYLFIAPDLLKIIRAMMATYCSERAPGMLCFEEIQGVVRITRNLLRAAEDETNKPHRPRQLPDAGNDYHYPEYRKLMRTLENINRSCDTVLKEQVEYEKKAELEEQRKSEAKNEKLRKQQQKELLRREHEEKRKTEAEEAVKEQRIRAEKLRAWQERNAPILNQWKGKEVPRQFARSVPPVLTPNSSYQAPFAGSQGMLAERIEEVGMEVEDPFALDVRAIQPIINGRPRPQQPQVDDRPVELRRKPVVAASGRKMPWAQNGQMPQIIVRPHNLPMSNNESDDDAFGAPQQPKRKRKFVHHPVTPDEEVDPNFNHDDARLISDDEPLMPMDLDSEEEELPEHPAARRVPRARIEEEERSLTQRRLDEEQRLKLLKAEAEDLEKERLAKLAAIAEVERRKAELEIQEREYYATRDQANGNVGLELDELHEDEREDEVDGAEADVEVRKVKMEVASEGEEDEEGEKSQNAEEHDDVEVDGDKYGVSGDEDDQPDEDSNNNNKAKSPAKPWTHEDLSELITHLKFYGKYPFSLPQRGTFLPPNPT